MQTMILEAIPIILAIFAYCPSRGIETQSLKNYGGTETSPEEIPYIVSIVQNNNHICGGVIIEKHWIITTAHCVEHKYGLEIHAGLVNLLNPGRNLQKVGVKEVFLHPLYVNRNESVGHDIALLKLGQELEFNLAVEPISLLSTNQMESYIKTIKTAIISGWGSSESADAAISNKLFSAEIELLTNEECEEVFPNRDDFVPNAHLCSFPSKSERLAEFLDDGGPLVMMDKLGGIIIHGKQNRNKNRPILSTVYAGIPFIQSFIELHVPHLYHSNGEWSTSYQFEKRDSFKFDLILLSVPSTNSIAEIKTFSLTYNLEFPGRWRQTNPEKHISRSQSSQCSNESVHGIEKWILSIEIIKPEESPEDWMSLFFSLSNIVNVSVAKYIE